MTVVSSFTATDLDPERLRSTGMTMLRDYLAYAESGGTDLGRHSVAKPGLNGFELDVQRGLGAPGLRLMPQYGASGYWIDFAAMHPARPGQPVLAIEADGATYHSSQTARDRDRLRQEHLERLGWRSARIWSTAWARNPEAEVERVVEAYQAALRDVDDGGGASVDPPTAPIDACAPPRDPERRSRPRIALTCPVRRTDNRVNIATEPLGRRTAGALTAVEIACSGRKPADRTSSHHRILLAGSGFRPPQNPIARNDRGGGDVSSGRAQAGDRRLPYST